MDSTSHEIRPALHSPSYFSSSPLVNQTTSSLYPSQSPSPSLPTHISPAVTPSSHLQPGQTTISATTTTTTNRMMNRLTKKRRPSEPSSRPGTGFSTRSNSESSLLSQMGVGGSGVGGGGGGAEGGGRMEYDAMTIKSGGGIGDGFVEIKRSREGGKERERERERERIGKGVGLGLPQLEMSQGDFRGSVIIGSLSKRFSVLRLESPLLPPAPATTSIPISTSSSSLSQYSPNMPDSSSSSSLTQDRHHAVVPPPSRNPLPHSSSTSTVNSTSPSRSGGGGGGSNSGANGTGNGRMASPISPATPTGSGSGSGWPAVSLSEIRHRLALQRQKGGLNHIREEEEEQVLGELVGVGEVGDGGGPKGGRGIAWGAQGQGGSNLNRTGGGGVPAVTGMGGQDFRSSPSEWGKELLGGGSAKGDVSDATGMSRSSTAPGWGSKSMSTTTNRMNGMANGGSSNSRSITPSQTMPNLASYSTESSALTTPTVSASSETRGSGFGASVRDENMMMALQRKGRKREEARHAAAEQEGEEGVIRFDGPEETTEKATPTTEEEEENNLPKPSPLDVKPLQPRKRQSYIAALSQKDVARISSALWEVEEDILRQLREGVMPDQQYKGTNGQSSLGDLFSDEAKSYSVTAGPASPEKSDLADAPMPVDATPPPRVKRVNSRRKPSITRSPAYHDNLAAVVEADLSAEIEKFDLGAMGVKPEAGVTGSTVTNLLRDDSGKFSKEILIDAKDRDRDRTEDVFTTGSKPSIPLGRMGNASPTIPLRNSSASTNTNFPSPTSSTHSRSMSASAIPVSKVSIVQGYNPGQPRPFTPDKTAFSIDPTPLTPSAVYPREDENVTPPARSIPSMNSTPTGSGHKRSASAGLTIQPPILRPGTFAKSFSSGGLPSVSPVVETFEESGTLADASTGHSQYLDIPQHGRAAAGMDPNDVSFDTVGFYGSPLPLEESEPSLVRKSSFDTLASSFVDAADEDDNLIKMLWGAAANEPPRHDQDLAGYDSDFLIPHEDMREAQDKLILAARKVRQAMLGSLSTTPAQSGSMLRARPSVRGRKVDMSTYDADGGVSQLVRAMSPRNLDPQDTPGLQRQGTSSSIASSVSAFTPPSAHDHSQSRANVISPTFGGVSPASYVPVSPGTIYSGAPAFAANTPEDSAKARLAKALYGPDEPTVPVGSHRRTESNVSNGSFRLDENPDVVKDFEARIARANAALQRNPSVTLSRQNTKSKVRLIGSPTLVDASSSMRVTPIKSPEPLQDLWKESPAMSLASDSTFSPAGNQIISPSRRPSQQTDTSETEASGKGIRGFISKLKRKDSKIAKPSSAASASQSPDLASFSEFQPPMNMGTSGLKRKPSTAAVVSHALQKAPSLSRRKVGLGVEGFDIITSREASIIAPRHPQPTSRVEKEKDQTRNQIVRRTIILANPELLSAPPFDGHDQNQTQTQTQTRSRKVSTRRKPVQYERNPHDSSEIQEDLVTPKLQQQQEQHEENDAHQDQSRGEDRLSTSNSFLDYYANSSEEMMRDGGDGSVPGSMSNGKSGSRDSTGSRAIEIREMSDGRLEWGVVNANEAPVFGHNDGRTTTMLRKASDGTNGSGSVYSYSEDYREIIQEGEGRGSERGRERRPETQVFYSAPDKVADLVNQLTASDHGHQGNFRIIPLPTGSLGTNEAPAGHQGGDGGGSGSGTAIPVQDRLRALLGGMKAVAA